MQERMYRMGMVLLECSHTNKYSKRCRIIRERIMAKIPTMEKVCKTKDLLAIIFQDSSRERNAKMYAQAEKRAEVKLRTTSRLPNLPQINSSPTYSMAVKSFFLQLNTPATSAAAII
jgi:hypothetical protein